MPLKIELKPHESIIIGESIITNDGERTRFYIEGNVPILREKFILRESEANTPSKRIYFVVQQMYLSKNADKLRPIYLEYVRDLQNAAPSLIPYISVVNENIINEDYYSAIKNADKLVKKEDMVIFTAGDPATNEMKNEGNVTNMLPGDIVTKYFCVKATHDSDFNLLFAAQITNQTKQLANALNIRISIPETDTVLYDGTFAQADKQELCKTVLKNDQGQTIIYYKIDVYMDTSVGNEYQAASLTADFDWYVNEQDSLTSPDTGDNLNIILWSVLLLSSAAIMLLLLLKSRKEENKR